MPLHPGGPAERHARQTITFDGSAGLGAVGANDMFTITGRVWIEWITVHCTGDLTEAGATATIALGGATDTDGFCDQINAVNLDNGEWWMAGTQAGGLISPDVNHSAGSVTAQVSKVTDEDIILTVGTQAVNGGSIVIDVLYLPITDDGVLVAA